MNATREVEAFERDRARNAEKLIGLEQHKAKNRLGKKEFLEAFQVFIDSVGGYYPDALAEQVEEKAEFPFKVVPVRRQLGIERKSLMDWAAETIKGETDIAFPEEYMLQILNAAQEELVIRPPVKVWFEGEQYRAHVVIEQSEDAFDHLSEKIRQSLKEVRIELGETNYWE